MRVCLGGYLCSTQADANYLFAASTSPSRINESVKNHSVPILDIQWIKDCNKSRQLLSIANYTIVKPKSKIDIPITNYIVSGSCSLETLNTRAKELPDEKLEFDDEIPVPIKEPSDENISIDPSFVNTKYACFRPTQYEPKYNKKLISFLMILERERILNNQCDKALYYQRAIAALKEAIQIIGIGRQISQIISEYLKTGVISEAKQLLSHDKFRTLSIFVKVFGVESTLANYWWNKGYRTLQEVLDKEHNLSPTIRLGIQLLPSFEQLMSRQDVEEIIKIIRYEVDFIDIQGLIVPVGSYRRGKEFINSLDLIVTNNNIPSLNNFSNQLIQRLSDLDYIKYILWHSTSDTKNNKGKKAISSIFDSNQMLDGFEKYFCAFLQPSSRICRQVNLIITNRNELYTAILSWTGSSYFEKSLKEYARKEKNLLISSKGISLKENNKLEKCTVRSEEDIFNLIGLPYIDPEFRNC
ncbi:uncharacterized protein BX663DRAFT_555834 [Cokeromyces recurvatus]|uniref:uncharacterized protein n=1 Tax=Cokeromyces recurvatus TaxID=90255 RepID=UPI00221F06FB|nr:uncharacterized protein BX663DRAFT_555834 [Cokeromyces recurvatus]KAI7898477.1 hypothetical protein BX663DRAFT_555834 [Cokeromyces recurvatus]